MANKVSPEEAKRQDHAYALVGRFMSHWAHLESAVNESVGALLKMGTVEATVATANMQLRSKLHIIKTMIDHQCGKSVEGKAALKDIECIGSLADNWRNMVAHVAFVPHGDGVRFLLIKAKGKLLFPNGEKSETDFLIVSSEILKLCDRVREITQSLKIKKHGTLADLAGMFAPGAPMPAPNALGPENYLGRLLLGSQGFPKATNAEDPQTPQEPQGK